MADSTTTLDWTEGGPPPDDRNLAGELRAWLATYTRFNVTQRDAVALIDFLRATGWTEPCKASEHPPMRTKKEHRDSTTTHPVGTVTWGHIWDGTKWSDLSEPMVSADKWTNVMIDEVTLVIDAISFLPTSDWPSALWRLRSQLQSMRRKEQS